MENPIIISNLNDFIFCPAISTVVDICVQTAARGVYKPYLISTVVDTGGLFGFSGFINIIKFLLL